MWSCSSACILLVLGDVHLSQLPLLAFATAADAAAAVCLHVNCLASHQDNEIMEQIDRDVMRTHPDMHFFSGDSADAEQHRREMKRYRTHAQTHAASDLADKRAGHDCTLASNPCP